MKYRELEELFQDGEGKMALSYILDIKPGEFLTLLDKEAGLEEEKRALEIIEERKSGTPLQYALGTWNFYGRDFKVDDRALIPRPETEVLVSEALKYAEDGMEILDLCTGSGAIGISLALEKNVHLTLSDISERALSLARENVERFDLVDRTRLIESDLFSDIDGKFDIIISNPPYVSKKEMDQLSKEVKKEPSLALYGGEDGLYFYRKIIKGLRDYLTQSGRVFLEIGQDQGEPVRKMFIDEEFPSVNIIKDFAGRDRIVEGFRRK